MPSWAASEDPCLARQLYTREEFAAMSALGDFVLHAVLEGPAWQAGASTCSCALERLEKRCGIPGKSSWYCGIVSENLLCAAMGGAADTSSRVSFEAAWLATADRLAMIRSCRDCEGAGAIVTSALCGRLTLCMPRSPKGFCRVAKAAWKVGLIIPAACWPASVGPMALTEDFPERFGGQEEDLPTMALATDTSCAVRPFEK